MVTYIFKYLIFMDDKLSIKYFFGTKYVRISMNNDVMMINKEHETFQFTLLNNIINRLV
jgi:hypothetical protein